MSGVENKLVGLVQRLRISKNQAALLHLSYDPTMTLAEVESWLQSIPLEYRTIIENSYAEPELSADETVSDTELTLRIVQGMLNILNETEQHPES